MVSAATSREWASAIQLGICFDPLQTGLHLCVIAAHKPSIQKLRKRAKAAGQDSKKIDVSL